MSLKKEMEKDYPLISIDKISEEARLLAVAWHENATNWIGDKHKLASDIMNYARRNALKFGAFLYADNCGVDAKNVDKELLENDYNKFLNQ